MLEIKQMKIVHWFRWELRSRVWKLVSVLSFFEFHCIVLARMSFACKKVDRVLQSQPKGTVGRMLHSANFFPSPTCTQVLFTETNMLRFWPLLAVISLQLFVQQDLQRRCATYCKIIAAVWFEFQTVTHAHTVSKTWRGVAKGVLHVAKSWAFFYLQQLLQEDRNDFDHCKGCYMLQWFMQNLLHEDIAA